MEVYAMTKSKNEIMDIINQAYGTEGYHKYSPIPGYPVATDGVIAVAEAGGCFWLLDVIGSYQNDKRLDPAFQVWKLEVRENRSAVVRGYNDVELIISQEIPVTDFPLEELKLFIMDGVLMLPSER
jgi:hypothetical protein